MKDFNVNKDKKIDEASIHADRKEVKLIDSDKLVPGLNVFELDLKDYSVKQLKSTSIDIHLVEKTNLLTGKTMSGYGKKKRVRYPIRENCLYVQATNLKNASKKFQKHLDRIIEDRLSQFNLKDK